MEKMASVMQRFRELAGARKQGFPAEC